MVKKVSLALAIGFLALQSVTFAICGCGATCGTKNACTRCPVESKPADDAGC
jgi:hypothetical protein